MIEKKQTKISTRTIIFIILSLVMLLFLISLLSSKESPKTTNTQIQSVEPQTIITQTPTPVPEKKELTSKQKSIQEFLVKEIELDNELQSGNNEVANAGNEFDYGVPLPYIIKAELIFENVLKESKVLVAPVGGEKVKMYLIEATNYALSGVKKIREGLESYPVDKTKLGQGLELYTKSQMSLARKNEEITKLKQEVGI